MPSNKLQDLCLYAWVGEDELGSGEIGLKQARVPAGMIPIVATSQAKAGQEHIREQMEAQARQWGKRICLVKFTFSEILMMTGAGDFPNEKAPVTKH